MEKRKDVDRLPSPKRARTDDPEATPLMNDEAEYIATPKYDDSLSDMHGSEVKKEVVHSIRQITDEDLDHFLPSEGYEIVLPPVGFESKSDSMPKSDYYEIPSSKSGPSVEAMNTLPVYLGAGDMPELKADDMIHFSALMKGATDEQLTPEQAKERKILALLLKIKNGTPQMRKQATKLLIDQSRHLGPEPIFNNILPLLMSATIDDQERHILVKLIDRLLLKLQDQVRPFVHKILVVIEPLLIDEDYYARLEGREVIANLSKAAGLPTMIATMRPDIDHPDDYVRNTTARALAVVASSLGVQNLVPFLKAVCSSKRSWQARHTGVKIVQQIAILIGAGVLPFLYQLVDAIKVCISDEHQKVRTMTALAVASLAEASTPFGIEAFEAVRLVIWRGAQEHRGKGLAAFVKAVGFLIPLMDPEEAGFSTKEIMPVLIREFSTPDDEIKRIVLKALQQCVGTAGVDASFIRDEVLQRYFENLWVVRNSVEKRNYDALVSTTVALSGKVGGSDVISYIVIGMKDPSEPFRKMVLETVHKVIELRGLTDISARLEEQIVDGVIYTLNEQVAEDSGALINGCASIVNTLGIRVKPYLPQLAGMLRWRLNQPATKTRQQAADMIAKIPGTIMLCNEEKLLSNMGLFIYEFLGEEYPEVLGSLLGALRAIVNVIGMANMTPPIRDLLPRLTPILKNRHEKVQENCIELIGRIADRGPDLAPAREWNRICFDLLDLLKAPKKSVRRCASMTFGYIARAIGPHDVIGTLLNNLKVQERQLRVCTTVAIAIVAETCGPFTVLPAMMNEYKVPDINVQTSILKAISFMFEYLGTTAKDYVYALTPLIEDGLTDRDLTHRHTAAWAVKHLALGVAGLGCEDSLQHLFNYVWPNIFETAPHMIQSFFDAMDAFRVALGAGRILPYILSGLFHPARRVRECYWRVYNHLYMGAQDALTPAYPIFSGPNESRFRSIELELVL